MSYAIRFRLSNVAALAVLVSRRAPKLLAATWNRVVGGSESGGILESASLTLPEARKLGRAGVDVVQVSRLGSNLTLTPLFAGSGETETFLGTSVVSGSFVEAVPLETVPGNPTVEEAIFWIPTESSGALGTIERLLAFHREDARIAEVIEDGRTYLLVRVAAAPLYLLMRSREEPDEAVRAYAKVGSGSSTWVEWGYRHPLPEALETAGISSPTLDFFSARGAVRRVPAETAWRSVFDSVTPEFSASAGRVEPREGEPIRFRVRLRLADAPRAPADLWVFSPEEFLGLERVIETIPAELLERFSISRTVEGETYRVRYLVTESIRPGSPRVGDRFADLLPGIRGYSRVPGVEGLYLPVGRKFVPTMRREELREMVGLGSLRAVVVTEDGDGPKLLSITSMDERPLSTWIEYVATDHRAELDRLGEALVFDWPEIAVEREKKREASAPPKAPKRGAAPKASAPRIEAPLAPIGARGEVEARDPKALARAKELEAAVLPGGLEDAATWAELGNLKLALRDPVDAVNCYENLIFFEGSTPETVKALARARDAEMKVGALTSDEILGLVLRPNVSTVEASRLALALLTLSVSTRAEDRTLLAEVREEAARRFSTPSYPVSRRMAWNVVRALSDSNGDGLALSRARDALLGGCNRDGLNPLYDLPRFVRFGLAATGSSGASAAGSVEQLRSLERLWARVEKDSVRPLESKGGYLRLIFALGFSRLGDPQRAETLAAPVVEEIPAHEVPNQALFTLYGMRRAFLATGGDEATWSASVDAEIAKVSNASFRDRVRWLQKRSRYLRVPGSGTVKESVRSDLEKIVSAETVSEATVRKVLDSAEYYDYEIAESLLRIVDRLSGEGDAKATVAALRRIEIGAPKRMTLAGHRARLLGRCVTAAAFAEDSGLVDSFLSQMIGIASGPNPPTVRELLTGVLPAVRALRRIGARELAASFLAGIEAAGAAKGGRSPRFLAALSEGYLFAGDETRARELIERAVEATLAEDLRHVEKYEAAVAVFDALEGWPLAYREEVVEKFLREIDRFTDTFTPSQYRLYETLKVQLAEGAIDAIVSSRNYTDPRIQEYLDEEEQTMRRRITADWKERCSQN